MRIPTHPQPGFFETTVVKVGDNLITHHDIQEILDTPPWSFQDALARVEARRACPTCGERVGPCVTSSGKTRLSPHVGRYL